MRGQTLKTHAPRWFIDTDFFSFGFTRNPWDRLVSLYFFCCQKVHNDREPWDQTEVRGMGFEKWLLEHRMFLAEDIDYNDPVRMQERDQYWWLEGCDFVGQFERLEEDASFLQKKLKTRPAELSKWNPSQHRDYRTYYTPEMVDFVAEKHKTTIDRIGYDFENIYRL